MDAESAPPSGFDTARVAGVDDVLDVLSCVPFGWTGLGFVSVAVLGPDLAPDSLAFGANTFSHFFNLVISLTTSAKSDSSSVFDALLLISYTPRQYRQRYTKPLSNLKNSATYKLIVMSVYYNRNRIVVGRKAAYGKVVQ